MKIPIALRVVGTVLFDFGCFILKIVAAMVVVFGLLAALIKFPTAAEIVFWVLGSAGLLVAGLLFLFYLSEVYRQHDRKSRHGN